MLCSSSCFLLSCFVFIFFFPTSTLFVVAICGFSSLSIFCICLGALNEFICSARLDNLMMSFCLVKSLVDRFVFLLFLFFVLVFVSFLLSFFPAFFLRGVLFMFAFVLCGLPRLLCSLEDPQSVANDNTIRLVALFDNEEVGSASDRGAASNMMLSGIWCAV